ncbi:hypothetical protein KSNIM_15375, partial [Kitasatospora sp. DSM 101779]|nr:hypothetical protein [Kitasatospora sp. DSM 101779]
MSSRESDSAYPSPRGANPGRRTADGADAYPSGTPPYGTGLPGAAAFAHGRSDDPFGTATQGAGLGGPEAAVDDVPRTETTLTTRVRINIPGSRPIPPVVVRSPVKNEEPPAGPGAPRQRAEAAGSPVLGLVDTGTTEVPPNLPPEWQEGGPQGTPAGGPSGGGQARPDGASESESTGAWFRPRQKGRQDTGAAPVLAGTPGAAPQPAPQASQAAAQAAPQTAPRPAAGAPRPTPQG